MEAYAAAVPTIVQAAIQGCLASGAPPELCPTWAERWAYEQLGRMDASYRRYTGEESRDALGAMIRAFMNEGGGGGDGSAGGSGSA